MRQRDVRRAGPDHPGGARRRACAPTPVRRRRRARGARGRPGRRPHAALRAHREARVARQAGAPTRSVRRVLRRPERPAVDELDAIAVGVRHERDQRQVVAAAGAVGRLLGLHAERIEVAQDGLDVVDGERHVVVARAEVVGLVVPAVDGQLEHVAVARQAHVEVVRRLEVQPPPRLEAERPVEALRRLRVADAKAGVHVAVGHAGFSPYLTSSSAGASLASGAAPPGSRPFQTAWPVGIEPVRSCSVMYSAWRIASATIVSVGFAAAPVVNWLASDTNRFATSCAWPKALTTPSSGRSLILAVPMLCVAGYGGVRIVRTAPTASYSASPADHACSRIA